MMTKDPLLLLFEKALQARNIRIKQHLSPDDVIIELDGSESRINLRNARKEYERTHGPECIEYFVDAIVTSGQPLPNWPEARTQVRLSLEPTDYDFGTTVYSRLTSMVAQVGVCVRGKEQSLRWINDEQLAAWSVSRAEFLEAARQNMAALMQQTSVEVEDVAGYPLAMLNTPSILNASLILSPNFKARISEKIDWPVFAVVPCRDFILVFPQSAEPIIHRLGATVLKEYLNSAYPVTTEVLSIRDDGITAIGKFEAPK